eukprot:6477873-Amphidinium_carterae.1
MACREDRCHQLFTWGSASIMTSEIPYPPNPQTIKMGQNGGSHSSECYHLVYEGLETFGYGFSYREGTNTLSCSWWQPLLDRLWRESVHTEKHHQHTVPQEVIAFATAAIRLDPKLRQD